MTVPVTKLMIPPSMAYPTGSQIANLICFLLFLAKMRKAHDPHSVNAKPVRRSVQ